MPYSLTTDQRPGVLCCNSVLTYTRALCQKEKSHRVAGVQDTVACVALQAVQTTLCSCGAPNLQNLRRQAQQTVQAICPSCALFRQRLPQCFMSTSLP